MATVYLAEDIKHHRQVALKVLRPDLAITLGSERFIREITVAANLSHPHVLPLYDSGEAGGFLFYVMPYVDGPSLRQKLVRAGELPIADTARILRDVADALAYAHSRGVVHRDIKPENVMLSGRHALVTDFGVAKAVSEATGRHQLTTAGVALGTPTYMAPEQATADPHMDHRADIYAFGCLAYELLTGQPPFTAATPQAVLAAHLTVPVTPITAHRASIPATLAVMVMRCLEKKPADRYQSAEEMIPVLEALLTPSGGTTPAQTAPHAAIVAAAATPRGRRLVMILGAVAIVAAVIAAVMSRAPAPLVLGQTTQLTLEPGLELYPALSPDGRMVAFTAGELRSQRIFVKAVSGGSAVQVTREPSGDHILPRWSPDGSQILFCADDGIYVVPALGGTPRALATGSFPDLVCYATWSPDGSEIAYVQGTRAVRDTVRIIRRSAAGGEPRVVVRDIEIHSLTWSPDGKWFAYVSGNFQFNFGGAIMGNLGPSAVHLVPAAGGDPLPLTDRRFMHTSPAWMPDSRSLLIVSSRGGGRDVYRIRFGRRGAIGEPERVTTGLSAATVDVAPSGELISYSRFTNDANIWAIGVPASGSVSVRDAVPVTRGSQHVEGLSASRDGKWLTYDSDRSGNADIWKVPTVGGEPVQLTTDPRDDFIPSWSFDGRMITFHSWRSGNRDVFTVQADGQGETRITQEPAHEMYPSWSPDGQKLLFHSNVDSGMVVYSAARTASGWSAPSKLSASQGSMARWSPDGRSIAFLGDNRTDGDGRSDPRLGRPIVVMDVARGPVRTLATGRVWGSDTSAVPLGLEWTADSRALIVKTGVSTNAAFWQLPVSGGPPRLLVRFDDPSRRSGRSEFAYARDRIYFTIEDRQSDVFVASLAPRR